MSTDPEQSLWHLIPFSAANIFIKQGVLFLSAKLHLVLHFISRFVYTKFSLACDTMPVPTYLRWKV